jgi:hypothetical protein
VHTWDQIASDNSQLAVVQLVMSMHMCVEGPGTLNAAFAMLLQGDVKKLMNDVDALKPTLFAGGHVLGQGYLHH